MKFSRRKPPSLAWILLPLVVFLLFSATADLSFGRQAPPTQVPPMEGGGDEWPNTTVGPSGISTYETQRVGGAGESTARDNILCAWDDPRDQSASNHANVPRGGPSIWIWILIRIL